MDGWLGGTSSSAKRIDIFRRLSYKEGFDLQENFIPDEEPFMEIRDEYGMIQINNWEDYYILRNISKDSPVALLLTFPLTLYHCVRKYGIVPVIVAKMEQRPLKIHVVGVEKELNFLDMFKEFAFLLPLDLKVCFVLTVFRCS